MASQNRTCNICVKRVLSHAHRLQCSNCKDLVHVNCLPFVSKTDSIYKERENNLWFCKKCVQTIFPFNHYDEDDEFMEVLSESCSHEPPVPIDIVNNSNKLFIPFELNDNENLPIHDADPDLQFYPSMCNRTLNACDYHLEDSFNQNISKLNISSRSYPIIHTNIRSAPKNLNNFESYLDTLNHEFSVIGLSESWLKPATVDLFGLDGYKSEHTFRPLRTGGGVSLFIKDHIEYTVRPDMCLNNEIIESLFIEIDKQVLGKTKNVLIGVIYRPPGTDIKRFNDRVEELLAVIKSENKLSYMMGDWNINLLSVEQHEPSQDFLDLMMSHSLVPIITKPTRVTHRSATLIDNIFSGSLFHTDKSFSGILYTDISDHYPIFHIDYSYESCPETQYIQRRIYSENNISKFKQHLDAHDWSAIYESTDPQIAYSNFHEAYSKMYNMAFPLKNIKIGYKTRKPWLSEELKNGIKYKNKLYYRQKKSNNPELTEIYKKYKNRLNGLLIHAEKTHYDKLFKENQNNLKSSWKLLKEIINRKKATTSNSRFIINGNMSTDKGLIAEGFNSFFINVGPTLANKIPPTNISPTANLKNRNINSMFVEPVTEKEIEDIIKNLKISSAGWDAISASAVKKSYSSVLSPLSFVMNLSITCGVFPNELKLARVIPLFKAGDVTSFSNYRPVSVLPLFSKILERLMYSRLLLFINENKLLYAFQFGFRKDHSPNLALVYLVDKISNALEDGEFVLGVFLDFSKAFDTVNHDILFSKLEFYGVRDVSLNWFKSYFNSRQQFVEYNGATSKSQNITCGVPQGSILGPLLFLIYINDLASVSSKIFTLLFADDSNLFLSGNNPNTLIQTMNTEIDKVIDWLKMNKLSLNLKKTHFMLFRRRRARVLLDTDLVIDGVKIDMVNKTKFLGVIIDPHLTFKSHILYIKGKVARGVGILNKCKKYLNASTLVTLYYSFLYPYFNYCNCIWGNTYQSYLTPLIKLQKRAVRIISFADRNAHTEPLFKKLKILDLSKVFVYCVQLFMFKYHHGLVPSIFQKNYVFNHDLHEYMTRQSDCMHSFGARTTQRYKTLRFVGIKIYNHFIGKINMDRLFMTYKYHLKKYLVDNDMSCLTTN